MAIVSMLYGAGGASSAEDVSYDNTTSGLEADNVQDAIDEVNAGVDALDYDASDSVTVFGGLTANFTRKGNVCSVSFVGNPTEAVTLSGWTKIVDIPEGFRPKLQSTGYAIDVQAKPYKMAWLMLFPSSESGPSNCISINDQWNHSSGQSFTLKLRGTMVYMCE